MNETKRKKLNLERVKMLQPFLQLKINQVIDDLEQCGLKPLITQGFRSYAEQNALYAIGRTKKGKIVTNARGGQSKHNLGKAVDFAFVEKDGSINWDLTNFRKLGKIAKSHGLKWGGDWKKFRDYPHIEI